MLKPLPNIAFKFKWFKF